MIKTVTLHLTSILLFFHSAHYDTKRFERTVLINSCTIRIKSCRVVILHHCQQLTCTIVCISACELYCAVMFSLWVFFVFFVLSFRIKPTDKAIIQQIHLQKIPVGSTRTTT